MRGAILSLLIAGLIGLPSSADSTERKTLGYGRLFNNDVIGDNFDRWRTGSNVVSKVTGFSWDGVRPERAGQVIEYRLRSELMAPENLVSGGPPDRRYAGTLSFGIHTHFQRGGTEFSLGADLVATGPQTGLGTFQREIHEIFGAPTPGVLDDQIGNGVHPTATVEVGRRFHLGPALTLRPFVEAQAGAETLVRVGGDIVIGEILDDDLMLRDVATGHLYRATRGTRPGLAAVFGGDIAHVEHSIYLPAYDGYVLTDARPRLRAGLHWQGQRTAVFYGLTWLGEEFEAQRTSQIVGSVRLDFRF